MGQTAGYDNRGLTVAKLNPKRVKKVAKTRRSHSRTIKPGSVVVFEPKHFNPEFWDNLSEKDRKRSYGPLGYGAKKPKFFVYLTEIVSAPGHCVLVDLDDQSIQTMRHTTDFRVVTDDEF